MCECHLHYLKIIRQHTLDKVPAFRRGDGKKPAVDKMGRLFSRLVRLCNRHVILVFQHLFQECHFGTLTQEFPFDGRFVFRCGGILFTEILNGGDTLPDFIDDFALFEPFPESTEANHYQCRQHNGPYNHPCFHRFPRPFILSRR